MLVAWQGCAFDKDGTLTLPYAESVYPVIQESLDQCRAAFDGNIALFSNSAGLYQYDPTGDGCSSHDVTAFHGD